MTKLDLHGVKHEDVRRKVISFIEEHWDTGKEVEVITGNSKRMRCLVTEVLMEYDLDYTEGGGFWGTNTGSITIDI